MVRGFLLGVKMLWNQKPATWVVSPNTVKGNLSVSFSRVGEDQGISTCTWGLCTWRCSEDGLGCVKARSFSLPMEKSVRGSEESWRTGLHRPREPLPYLLLGVAQGPLPTTTQGGGCGQAGKGCVRIGMRGRGPGGKPSAGRGTWEHTPLLAPPPGSPCSF